MEASATAERVTPVNGEERVTFSALSLPPGSPWLEVLLSLRILAPV